MRTEGKHVVAFSADYIVGLTAGEGCFLVCLRKDFRIDLRFFISQAEGNRELLEGIQRYFGVGSAYQKSSRDRGRLSAWVFEVAKRDDIYETIIPFFKKHKLKGYKAKSFAAFCEIAKIVKGRQDTRKLDPSELEYVRKLKLGMNKHYGSPGAGKPHAGAGTRNNLSEA